MGGAGSGGKLPKVPSSFSGGMPPPSRIPRWSTPWEQNVLPRVLPATPPHSSCRMQAVRGSRTGSSVWGLKHILRMPRQDAPETST